MKDFGESYDISESECVDLMDDIKDSHGIDSLSALTLLLRPTNLTEKKLASFLRRADLGHCYKTYRMSRLLCLCKLEQCHDSRKHYSKLTEWNLDELFKHLFINVPKSLTCKRFGVELIIINNSDFFHDLYILRYTHLILRGIMIA